jgi:hypothetical protein
VDQRGPLPGQPSSSFRFENRNEALTAVGRAILVIGRANEQGIYSAKKSIRDRGLIARRQLVRAGASMSCSLDRAIHGQLAAFAVR